MKFYGIYRITNLVNGKMYVGQHVTEDLDDGYMGSGVVILRALKKYGRGSFRKEWLTFCEDEEELDYMERVFVDQTWVDRADTYNIALGGVHNCARGGKLSPEAKLKISNALKGRPSGMLGKRHSEESKRLMSQSQSKSWTAERREEQRQRASGVAFSDDRKNKISSAIKGRRWWNNGEISVMKKECPPGFVPGMLKKGEL